MSESESRAVGGERSWLGSRDIDLAVAEHVLGLHVEKVTPDWYGREVMLFFLPEGGHVVYSYDDNACNAMMYRNGIDATDGTAPPLPHFSTENDDADEVEHRLTSQGWFLIVNIEPPGPRFQIDAVRDGLAGEHHRSPYCDSRAAALAIVALRIHGIEPPDSAVPDTESER